MEETIEILSVPVRNVSMDEATDFVFSRIAEGRATTVATANAEMIMRAKDDHELARILAEADLVVPDGAGVLWAAEQQGKHFKERVAGVDLACRIMARCVERQTKVYFFGGAPGIAETAARNMKKKVGEFPVVGVRSGFFAPEEEPEIIEDIRNSGASVLFVALGVPKQEKWIHRHLYELGPCVCMGVGGTFDVLAGHVCRAPKWMQEHRLEWLYRLYKEPSRAMRMLALPKFVVAVKFGSRV
ncbi:MAG: glycosyltransferase [Anaeroglobus sp.]|nr:glycosyltransferase [Anaeroglobus sp.]